MRASGGEFTASADEQLLEIGAPDGHAALCHMVHPIRQLMGNSRFS
jgi:hypothetical protein